MDKNLDFELETRKKIYNYILKNPGVHLRELQRNLNIKIFNLKYHVQKLVKNGCIIQKKEDGYLRFFVIHTVSNGDKKVLGILRQKTARHIVLVALYEIAVSQKEICDFLQKSPSTINFHIKNLLKNNSFKQRSKRSRSCFQTYRSSSDLYSS